MARKFTGEDAKFADKAAQKIKDGALKLATEEGRAKDAESPFWILTSGTSLIAVMLAHLENGNAPTAPPESKFYERASSSIKRVAAAIASENGQANQAESSPWLLLSATSLVVALFEQIEKKARMN